MCTFIGLTDLTIVSFLDFQIQKGVFVISGHKMEPNVEMTYMYKDSEGGAFEPIKIFPIFFTRSLSGSGSEIRILVQTIKEV